MHQVAPMSSSNISRFVGARIGASPHIGTLLLASRCSPHKLLLFLDTHKCLHARQNLKSYRRYQR